MNKSKMIVPIECCARFGPRWIGGKCAVLAIRRNLINSVTGKASIGRAVLPVSSPMIFSRSRGLANSFEGSRTAGTFRGGGGVLANAFPFQLSLSKLRWNSYSKRRTRVPRMSDCRTLGEAIEATHANLEILSPRDVAAFWAVVPKFIQKGGQGGSHDESQQIYHRFDAILCRTVEEISSYGSRDLATTTLAFAKIVEIVGVEGKNMPSDSPRQILHDLMVGTESENKHFIFQEVILASMAILEEFDARHLSNFIYAFSLAGHVHKFKDGSTFFDMLALAAIPKLKRFNGQDLANMLWAYANLGVSNSQLFKKAGDIIEWGSLETFNGQDIANIVWAFAKLNEPHPKFFNKVADHVVSLHSLGGFKSQNLSNIVWAYATAEASHPKLFNKIANHVVSLESLVKFDPQELANIVCAYATAEESQPELFNKVADHIMALNNLRAFIPQDLSNIVWAYAKVNEPHPKLFKKVSGHITALNNLEAFIPQALANIVWAYTTAKESHPALFRKLAEAAIQRKAGFDSQGIANFLWAHAANGHRDENLFQTLAPMAEALLDKCNGQALANIAWAYAVVNESASSLFDESFVMACKDKEREFTVEDLRQLHQWQIWQEELKSNLALHSPLRERCHDVFVSRVPRSSALQDDVVSGLKAIGLQPEEEVLTRRGYRLDAVVEVDGNKVGVEVDGPSHFLERRPTGSTILKRRQVTNAEGLPLVSVPYWEWGKPQKDRPKKQKYLCSLLGLNQA